MSTTLPPIAATNHARMGAVVTGLAFAIIMVDGFDLQAIGYVAPEIARQWSMPLTAFGSVFAAALAGSILGALLAGPAARIAGLRNSLAISLLLFGALTLSLTQATSLTSLVVLRLLSGIGLGAAVPVATSLVARHSLSQWRVTLLTLTLCGQPLGAILGGALSARIMPLYGWQSAFYVGGALPLLLAPVLLWLSPRDKEQPASADERVDRRKGTFGELFRKDLRMTSVILPASAFLSSGFLYIIINWLPGIMRAADYSLTDSVLAVSLFNIGGIAGGLGAARLIDRFGPYRVLPPLYLVAAAATALLGSLTADRPLLLVAACISGLAGYGAVMNLGPLAILLYPPTLHAMGLGWVLAIGRLGGALGPWAVGLLLTTGTSRGHLFYVAATATIIVSLCLSVLARVRAR